jgi:hypothetical protein
VSTHAPGQVLAAVDRDHAAGDAARAGEIDYRRRNVLRRWPALERHQGGLCGDLLGGVWRRLGSVGPGATALTRSFGASVTVAAASALLLKV